MSEKKRGQDVIIAGNWKMHKSRSESRELALEIKAGIEKRSDLPGIVLCPPFTSLTDVVEATKGSAIQVGAQNMDYRDSGAFTGEVSPIMLKDVGCFYVLIGHSERRQFFGETNASVNLKVRAALAHKLEPIICVGESSDERDAGLTDQVVRRQVGAALGSVEPTDMVHIVIAYEPVWAIGTGRTCEAKEAARVSSVIRATINDLYRNQKEFSNVGATIPVLYGGSVKPSNIDEILAENEVDGALVGGASLKSEDFLPLVYAGQKRMTLIGSSRSK